MAISWVRFLTFKWLEAYEYSGELKCAFTDSSSDFNLLLQDLNF